MNLQKSSSLIMISLIIIVLAGCGVTKEIETYFDNVHDDVMEKNLEVEKAQEGFMEAIIA